MLGQFLDELGIDQVDLVANDSGVGIALIFAAPATESDIDQWRCADNWPPKEFSGFPYMVARADSQAPLGKDRPFRGS